MIRYFAIIGARVCRSCFHATDSPTELCSADYAQETLGLDDSTIMTLPFIRLPDLEYSDLASEPQTDRTAVLVLWQQACTKSSVPLSSIGKRYRATNGAMITTHMLHLAFFFLADASRM